MYPYTSKQTNTYNQVPLTNTLQAGLIPNQSFPSQVIQEPAKPIPIVLPFNIPTPISQLLFQYTTTGRCM